MLRKGRFVSTVLILSNESTHAVHSHVIRPALKSLLFECNLSEDTFTIFEIQTWLSDFIMGITCLRNWTAWPVWAEVPVTLGIKPCLYFSRRLSTTVAYRFFAGESDYGRHCQLSSKCAQILYKYKQSPDRTTKWSIHGIQIQMRIQIRIQIP